MSTALASSVPSPFLFDPSTCFISLSAYPWATLARHFTALVLYGFTFAQWPTYSYHNTGMEPNAGYTLSTATFTLVFWCACFFHYAVSAGRVDVDWASGRFVARGWLVRSSRTTHRAILVIALAISSATVIQTSTVHSILFMEQLVATSNGTTEPKPEDCRAITLLKADFVLCIVFAIYLGVRLCVEPTGLLKRRHRRMLPTGLSAAELSAALSTEGGADANGALLTTQTGAAGAMAPMAQSDAESEGKGPVVTSLFKSEPPDMAEECQICLQRMANRQLNCGHLICCCCIIDLIKTKAPSSLLICPFCRQQMCFAKELRLVVMENPVRLTQCCSIINSVAMV